MADPISSSRRPTAPLGLSFTTSLRLSLHLAPTPGPGQSEIPPANIVDIGVPCCVEAVAHLQADPCGSGNLPAPRHGPAPLSGPATNEAWSPTARRTAFECTVVHSTAKAKVNPTHSRGPKLTKEARYVAQHTTLHSPAIVPTPLEASAMPYVPIHVATLHANCNELRDLIT